MLELKLKDNGTYTLKGLSEEHISTINALVGHVRLDTGTAGSHAAYELGELFEEEGFDMGEIDLQITREIPEEEIDYTIELN
jgi:hypothetical protein